MSRQPSLRSLLFCAALSSVPMLSGCFPVVAAGVGTAALAAIDRRTTGAQVEDEGIELRAANQISQRLGDKAHINVTSFNRIVLLTGEVHDEAARSQLEVIVSGLQNVKGVSNEAVVGMISSLTDRSNDALITSKVKARFVDASRFNAVHVKVVTEASVVYLMGLVTRTEADAAKQIASTTSGVKRVVAVFDIITDAQARELDSGGRAKK